MREAGFPRFDFAFAEDGAGAFGAGLGPNEGPWTVLVREFAEVALAFGIVVLGEAAFKAGRVLRPSGVG